MEESIKKSETIVVVQETNYIRTISLEIETPKFKEKEIGEIGSGWYMSEAGQIHLMSNGNPMYRVAVHTEDNKPHYSPKRGNNILYMQSKQEALRIYDLAVTYWKVQRVLENHGEKKAGEFMHDLTKDEKGWGGTSKIPNNPFEW